MRIKIEFIITLLMFSGFTALKFFPNCSIFLSVSINIWTKSSLLFSILLTNPVKIYTLLEHSSVNSSGQFSTKNFSNISLRIMNWEKKLKKLIKHCFWWMIKSSLKLKWTSPFKFMKHDSNSYAISELEIWYYSIVFRIKETGR